MAELIDMDALVPEDLEIKYRGQTYVFPGDIDVHTTFVLQDLLDAFIAAEASILDGTPTKAQKDAYKQAVIATEKELTALLRERDQEIEKFPFGATGFRVLLLQILMKLGFSFAETAAPLEKRTVPKTKRTSRSKPSSTSRSRSKSSGSSRRTGG